VTADDALMDVVMPQMGVSVAEGTVSLWLKSAGQTVAIDEPLLEVATDKVETEIPSPFSGVLAEILVQAGESVAIGAPLARVRPDGQRAVGAGVAAGRPGQRPASPAEAAGGRPSASVAPPADGVVLPGGVASVPPSSAPLAAGPEAALDPLPGPGWRASRSVVRLAGGLGVDLSAVPPTGPGSRVTREDLLRYAQALAQRPAPALAPEPATAPSPAPVLARSRTGQDPALDAVERAAPMGAMRREIASRLRHSVDTAVHVTSLIEVDMTSVVAARERTGPDAGPGGRPTLLAYVARAVVVTLPRVPWLNAQIRGDSIVTADRVNLGIAVSVADGKGLLVPVIKSADDLSLGGLASRIADLAARARSKTLSVDDLSGATFTITNLGGYGTFAGTPIINVPQMAVLGMYSMVRRPVVVRHEDGTESIGIRPIMNLSMSYDHRLIDGATAGAFLRDVRAFLENWRTS